MSDLECLSLTCRQAKAKRSSTAENELKGKLRKARAELTAELTIKAPHLNRKGATESRV